MPKKCLLKYYNETADDPKKVKSLKIPTNSNFKRSL
jgi:hypothetical protein